MIASRGRVQRDAVQRPERADDVDAVAPGLASMSQSAVSTFGLQAPSGRPSVRRNAGEADADRAAELDAGAAGDPGEVAADVEPLPWMSIARTYGDAGRG